MKVVGIIAEYNPFHNGHEFHMEETKRRTDADYVIVVISGSFVQRGAPALLSKYDRALMALNHGADLVFELPAAAALSSAEGFALGGISLLAGLGVTDFASCGCEDAGCPNELFYRTVRILSDEPPAYREALSRGLKSGMSFPAAREKAVFFALSSEKGSPYPESAINSLLSKPNNILSLEYARAIERVGKPFELIRIPRKGGPHGGNELSKDPELDFSSAAAIREALRTGSEEVEEALRRSVPGDVYENLKKARADHALLFEDDLSDLLFYAITVNRERLSGFGPVSPELTHRIAGLSERFTCWSGFADLVKTKNQTYTAVSRCLAHILLMITRDDLSLAASYRFAPYARLLGLKKEAAPLMRSIRANADIPVITRIAKDRDLLDPSRRRLLDIDIRSSEILRQKLQSRSGIGICPELRRPLIVVP